MKTIEISENQFILRFSGGGEDFYYEKPTGAFAVEGLKGAVGQRVSYNPLVIYGPSGGGKTHLLKGCLQDYKLEHPEKEARMLPARDLARELCAAIRNDGRAELAAAYGKLNLLVLDDMAYLKKKDATQEEIADIIIKICLSGGIVVMIMDEMGPDYYPLLRITKPKLQWGLVTDLRYPGPECRKNYAFAWRERTQADIPDRVLETFAARLPSICHIKAALTSYIAAGGSKTTADILRLYTPPPGEAGE